MSHTAYLTFFSGFYESIHSYSVSHELEMMTFAYEYTKYSDAFINLGSEIEGEVDYSEVYEKYSECYVDLVKEVINLPSLKFYNLYSPRWYNFETDQIEVSFDTDTLEHIWRNTYKENLKRVAKDRHTSCSGFHSFYSPNILDWPSDHTEWDTQQLSTLLEAYVKSNYLSFGPYNDLDACIAEQVACEYPISDWICGALNERGERLLKITDYLYERCQRPT